MTDEIGCKIPNKCMKKMKVKRGTFIESVLSFEKYVLIVEEGWVSIEKVSSDGERQILEFCRDGDVIFEDDDGKEFALRCVTDVTLSFETKEKIKLLMMNDMSLFDEVSERIKKRMKSMLFHNFVIGKFSADQKISNFIMNLYERQHGTHEDGCGKYVHIPLTRSEWGDYLGTTIETVSRTLSKMFKNKIIVNVPNGVMIHDMKKLKAMSDV